MDGESPEGGPDTPPNTPVTPSHKTAKEHHRQWKELDKSDPEPAACLGQHHQQRHHYRDCHYHYHHYRHYHHHDHHHHHDHDHHDHDHHHHHHHYDNSYKYHHFSAFEKKLSNGLQGICDVKTQSNNHSSSIYSCYHTHWCVASTSSTPHSSPISATPTSSSSSSSSNCSSEEELEWQQPLRPRTTENHPARSPCKSVEDDDNDDDDYDADRNNDQQSCSWLNPGTHPTG